MIFVDRRDFLRGSGAVAVGFWAFSDRFTSSNPTVENISELTTADTDLRVLDYPDIEFRRVRDEEQFKRPEYWQTPKEYVENNFRGDCEDYAFFSTTVLDSNGFESKTVIGYLEGEDEDIGWHATTELSVADMYLINDIQRPRALQTEEEWLRHINDGTKWHPLAELRAGERLQFYRPNRF